MSKRGVRGSCFHYFKHPWECVPLFTRCLRLLLDPLSRSTSTSTSTTKIWTTSTAAKVSQPLRLYSWSLIYLLFSASSQKVECPFIMGEGDKSLNKVMIGWPLCFSGFSLSSSRSLSFSISLSATRKNSYLLPSAYSLPLSPVPFGSLPHHFCFTWKSCQKSYFMPSKTFIHSKLSFPCKLCLLLSLPPSRSAAFLHPVCTLLSSPSLHFLCPQKASPQLTNNSNSRLSSTAKTLDP